MQTKIPLPESLINKKVSSLVVGVGVAGQRFEFPENDSRSKPENALDFVLTFKNRFKSVVLYFDDKTRAGWEWDVTSGQYQQRSE